jgi:hypothetical protein
VVELRWLPARRRNDQDRRNQKPGRSSKLLRRESFPEVWVLFKEPDALGPAVIDPTRVLRCRRAPRVRRRDPAIASFVGTQPKLFAYTFDNQPSLSGPYAPTPTAVNLNSAAGTNTFRSAGTGLRLVGFPRVAVLPSNVLVSSFKVGAGFCNLLSPWATATSSSQVIVRDVACIRRPPRSKIYLR